LKDKKIVFDRLPPFDILAKDKELQTKSPSSSKLKKVGKKKELLRWWTRLKTARTFFDQGSAI
jgi:hypothetical protein